MNDIIKNAEISELVNHTFASYLLANKPVLEYLNQRGIGKHIIEEEKIGYCPPFYNYWWPLLLGRITTPIKDIYGRIVAFAGRQYEPNEKSTFDRLRSMYKNPIDAEKKIEMWQNAKWINEPYPKNKHLYNLNYAKDFCRQKRRVIIVEGYLDAIVMAEEGIKETVALCGTRLCDRHCVLLSRYVDDAIILLDGDSAGEKALEHIIPKFKEFGINPHAVFLPSEYDPDEFVLQIGGKKVNNMINKVINNNMSQTRLKI